MVENLRKMQEMRAQIQAQIKLAETLRKLNENAGSVHWTFYYTSVMELFIIEMNNLEIGVNISEDLDQLRMNLNKLKKSNLGEELADIEIEKLDWIEDNKKMKAFIIYETSL